MVQLREMIQSGKEKVEEDLFFRMFCLHRFIYGAVFCLLLTLFWLVFKPPFGIARLSYVDFL